MEIVTSLPALVSMAPGSSDGQRIAFPQIEVIDFGVESIGEFGAKALAKALERCAFPGLKRMDLHSNKIGPDGAKAIASALEHGSLSNLRYVELGRNGIGNDGAKALAFALERSTLPLLECMHLSEVRLWHYNLNKGIRNGTMRARQRGRILLLLSGENDRCESAAKWFLRKDGDHAVMCRVSKFMLS